MEPGRKARKAESPSGQSFAAWSSWGDGVRILIVMAAHWPRALLRADLRQAGYDALGARDLDEALSHPKQEAGRGSVRLIILDQAVIQSPNDPRIAALFQKHPEAETLLLSGAFQPAQAGPWRQVIRHPVSIAEVTQAAKQLLPLPSGANPGD